MNRANKVLGIFEVSHGSATGTVADPKLIFVAAIKAKQNGITLLQIRGFCRAIFDFKFSLCGISCEKRRLENIYSLVHITKSLAAILRDDYETKPFKYRRQRLGQTYLPSLFKKEII